MMSILKNPNKCKGLQELTFSWFPRARLIQTYQHQHRAPDPAGQDPVQNQFDQASDQTEAACTRTNHTETFPEASTLRRIQVKPI